MGRAIVSHGEGHHEGHHESCEQPDAPHPPQSSCTHPPTHPPTHTQQSPTSQHTHPEPPTCSRSRMAGCSSECTTCSARLCSTPTLW